MSSEGPYREGARTPARVVDSSAGLWPLAVASLALVGTCAAIPEKTMLSCVRDRAEIVCVARVDRAFATTNVRIDGASIDVEPAPKNAPGATLFRVGRRWLLSPVARHAQPSPPSEECLSDPDEPAARSFFRGGRARTLALQANQSRHGPAVFIAIVAVPLWIVALVRAVSALRRARRLSFNRGHREPLFAMFVILVANVAWAYGFARAVSRPELSEIHASACREMASPR
ncbi:MAG: hypothetical protein U0269_13490 [Polyangiales bacterium]